MAARDAAASHQLEQELAETYLDTALLGRELATEAMKLALEQARAGELRDPAKTAMNAIITSGTALDKRLVLQNRPTQYIEIRDPKQAAAALARRLGVTLDSTAEDITNTELTPAVNTPQPLLSERASANARTHARQDTPD
jgi:hypothetical protein